MVPSQAARERAPSSLALLRWFDSWTALDDIGADARTIDWTRCVPFLLLHAACLLVFVVGWSPTAVALALGLYLIRMFAITGFYHRYFAHRSFRTGRVVQFLFALLGSTAVQRGPLWWASHHRHHHRVSDQPDDPHSPVQHGLLWSHMGWFMAKVHFAPRLEMVPDLSRFPELRLLDRFDSAVPILGGVLVYAVGATLARVAPGLGADGPQLLVWGLVSTVVLFHGTVTINSLAHRFGTRRYPTPDDSRNNLLLALLTLGEGWHNNHHHYPAAARQGHRFWEVDLTYYGLAVLSWLGLIWDLKQVPERVLAGAQGSSA